MACSKYEYVKFFEKEETLLKQCWIVCRIDGRGFTKFSETHKFQKPNDDRALWVMTAAALDVMSEMCLCLPVYVSANSFVLRPSADLYNRRESKILSTIVSMFTGYYVFRWRETSDLPPLKRSPVFDGRLILYPNARCLRDYLAWRQVDCHINNLYNYCFWKMVESGMSKENAHQALKITNSGDKNELLFSQFQINYNLLPQLHRKGTTLHRDFSSAPADCSSPFNFENFCGDGQSKHNKIIVHHEDLIRDAFWDAHSYLLTA
eukprot:Gregarina_sp_Poly_1__4541@NODE_2439_length_2135_cov_50_540135_g1549_i0_p2_GENE_NODE_2439_length_2135_cov_50_540135_g1549_i0NODE_2439_length_2135_cov_50_540135_g1549_i0_p2_ORF_typecomplete_len263_score42_75Thg1/PF04446_12/9_4e40Thg1/PF04446_12/1_1e04Thg1C/PF14413_6/2_1e36_NODE_2439_length_2135_cov_50_540135_g1549_i060848